MNRGILTLLYNVSPEFTNFTSPRLLSSSPDISASTYSLPITMHLLCGKSFGLKCCYILRTRLFCKHLVNSVLYAVSYVLILAYIRVGRIVCTLIRQPAVISPSTPTFLVTQRLLYTSYILIRVSVFLFFPVAFI